MGMGLETSNRQTQWSLVYCKHHMPTLYPGVCFTEKMLFAERSSEISLGVHVSEKLKKNNILRGQCTEQRPRR